MPLPRFIAIIGVLALCFAAEGSEQVELVSEDGGRAVADTYGARLVSWRPAGGEEVFAMALSRHKWPVGDQIHGGLPIYWPWFVFEGPEGCRIHGVTSYAEWRIKERAANRVVFALDDDEATRSAWPHRFHAELEYVLGTGLSATFRVTNTDTGSYACTEGFHPYFRVGDVRECTLSGTDGARYFCKAEAELGDARVWSGDFPCRLPHEKCAGYAIEEPSAEGRHLHVLADPVLKRKIEIAYEGNIKIGVWNSGPDFSQFGGADDPDYGLRFVCVEGATLYRDRAYTLKPGETHTLKAAIQVASSAAGSCPPEDLRLTVTEKDAANATAALQNAFDECFRAGGGTVTVEKGVYPVKGLRLRSNTTLLLKSGAVLKASRNCDDYDILGGDALEPVPAGEFAPGVVWVRPRDRKTNDHLLKPASRWNNAIIRILHARNDKIVGEPGAVIDGCDSYDPIGEEHFRGVHGISVHASTNLVFSGYTIRNTGNWAHSVWSSSDLRFEKLTILGGHDGVHFSVCDRVEIADCTMKTGDDCVAGFDNEDVVVRNCDFNTACSAFRFGGRRVLAENCRCWGPGEYPIRNSLPKADRISGSHGVPGAGRRTMLSFFTYYSDFTLKVRSSPGDITLRNCRIENAERFLHYNFSGSETWQKNRPLGAIRFENVEAAGLSQSLCAYGDEATKFSLALKDCRFTFAKPQREFVRGAHISALTLDGVAVDGVDGPCVRSWGDVAEPKAENLTGVGTSVEPAAEPFRTKSI